MKSSDILDFENDSVFEGEHNEFVDKDNKMFEGIMYMPTLPNAFNSLVGKTVRIETEKPQYIIELLGDLLGVEDYKTNKAAFWFLDAIALQVLRYKNCLDDHYRSVLISWLAGEMKLIRDRKLLREDFFKEMRILFLCVTEKLSSNDRLLHWDEYSKIMSQNPSTDASANNEAEYLITNKLSEKELITKDDKYMSQENKFFFLERELKDHNSSNSAINNLQERSSMNVKTSENLRTDVFANSNTAIGTFNLTNPSDVLDIIVEATYNMYANELRYALIYAVFAQPIQVQIFHMPHTVRLPRQIKLADPGGTFDLQLRERLEKIAESQRINGEKVKGKKMIHDTRKEQMVKEMEIPPPPPPSIIELEKLAYNRQFILPLIEANEAMQIFDMHAGNM